MEEQLEGFMDRLTAHLDRGWELVGRGDLNGAMASAEQTLQLDDASPDAHNLIGYIHAANGNVEMALDHYRQAIEFDEYYLEAMLNAAELLIHPLAEFAEAIRVLDQALECCQTTEEIADASILKVDALIQQGDRDAAGELLESLPEGPYDNAQLDFLIGRARLELGQIEKAAPLLERAAARQGAPADVHYYLGLLREGQERRTDAALAFLKTRHLDAQAPRAPWAPSPERFEKVVQLALREVPGELGKRLEGTLFMVTDLPGLEVVAEGVDPRAPLLVDEVPPGDGAEAHVRVFAYQRNIERLVRHPLELKEDLVEILSKELTEQLEKVAQKSSSEDDAES